MRFHEGIAQRVLGRALLVLAFLATDAAATAVLSVSNSGGTFVCVDNQACDLDANDGAISVNSLSSSVLRRFLGFSIYSVARHGSQMPKLTTFISWAHDFEDDVEVLFGDTGFTRGGDAWALTAAIWNAPDGSATVRHETYFDPDDGLLDPQELMTSTQFSGQFGDVVQASGKGPSHVPFSLMQRIVLSDLGIGASGANNHFDLELRPVPEPPMVALILSGLALALRRPGAWGRPRRG